MSYMADKALDIEEQGEQAWYTGEGNPYEEGTEEYRLFNRGWIRMERNKEWEEDAQC